MSKTLVILIKFVKITCISRILVQFKICKRKKAKFPVSYFQEMTFLDNKLKKDFFLSQMQF